MNPGHAIVLMNGSPRSPHGGTRRNVSDAEGILIVSAMAMAIVLFILMVKRVDR